MTIILDVLLTSSIASGVMLSDASVSSPVPAGPLPLLVWGPRVVFVFRVHSAQRWKVRCPGGLAQTNEPNGGSRSVFRWVQLVLVHWRRRSIWRRVSRRPLVHAAPTFTSTGAPVTVVFTGEFGL
jgi:hypothetical protein